MKVKAKVIIAACFIAAAVALPFFSAAVIKTSHASSRAVFKRIVIDAGHGGADGGATGVKTGVKEAEINLNLAKILQSTFEKNGYVVIMTRVDDNGLYGEETDGFKLRDLKKRVEIINSAKPDAVISVHMNKYSLSSRRGAQVFFKPDSVSSEILARSVQNELNAMKTAKRTYRELEGDYYILRESLFPAVICECGFLSNPVDEALLTDESHLNALAAAIFRGVNEFIDYNGI